MLRSTSDSRDEWKSAIQRLIKLGQNLHTVGESGFTMLRDILFLAEDPFDSITLGDQWLDILRGAGVDVNQYLREEISLNSHSFPTLGISWRKRHITITGSGASWDWFIEPDGPAYDALNEFKNFGPAAHNQSLLYEIDLELDPWPFVYSRASYYEWRIDGGWVFEEEEEFVERVRARNKRRWYQRSEKLDRLRGLRRSSHVPGAWIN
jgi:hypothetical protein